MESVYLGLQTYVNGIEKYFIVEDKMKSRKY